jgi:hypothetical protein
MRIVQLMTDRSRYVNPSKNYWFSLNAFLISLIGLYFQYTVRPDEAFRFTVGSFIENVWFVLVLIYRQTKANMLTLMLHETILII